MFESAFSYLAITLLLLGNGVLAAARAAFVNASRGALRQMSQTGVGGAALAVRIAEDATPLLAALRLGQTFCRFAAAGLVSLELTPLVRDQILALLPAFPQAGGISFLLIAVVATMLVIAVGEFVPEAFALRNPERSAIGFAPIVGALIWVLNPLIRLLLWLSDRVSQPVAGQRRSLVTEEEIKTLVDAGEEGGAIEEDEKEMIYSIFEISDTWAREIMVPRMDMLALDVETALQDAVDSLLKSGHSRVPVYQDNVDSIQGILYAKDLLRLWHENSGAGGRTLRELLRPAYFVPETKKVNELLAELQQRRIHMAIVIDEYGGTAGLVTLEDIVEEIVGDIRDEYDINEESFCERISDSEYLFDARISLDEVNELLHTRISTEDIDSLGGFIYGQLGHVPVAGETVTAEQVTFEVLTVTGRRIRKVRGTLAGGPGTDRAAASNGHGPRPASDD
jgi:CBS domain containing-hemolysin-like protein